MATQITVTYKGNEYELGFTRYTAKAIEDQGFVAEQVGDKPATMIPLLVYGAFMQFNRGIKRALVDEIYDNIIGKVGKDGEDGFVQVLLEMYSETVTSLMDDTAVEEGNAATWKVKKG